MIPVSEAIQIVLQHSPKLEVESVVLGDAMGRVLAEDIIADSDLPPFDRAQMDGYAVRAPDVSNTPARLHRETKPSFCFLSGIVPGFSARAG